MANQQKTINKKPSGSLSPRKKHGKYIVKEYTVVEFDEETGDRMFECLPNSWFVDESKQQCLWPPKCGTKTVMQRAVNCERPDEDTWDVYDCKVVQGGFLSYSAGFKIVKEKCSQHYNTSSAEERIEALNYRRKHPVLALQQKSFEGVFPKPNSNNITDEINRKAIEIKEKNDANHTEQMSQQIGVIAAPVEAEESASINLNQNQTPAVHRAINKSQQQNQRPDNNRSSSVAKSDGSRQINRRSSSGSSYSNSGGSSKSSGSSKSRSSSRRSRSNPRSLRSNARSCSKSSSSERSSVSSRKSHSPLNKSAVDKSERINQNKESAQRSASKNLSCAMKTKGMTSSSTHEYSRKSRSHTRRTNSRSRRSNSRSRKSNSSPSERNASRSSFNRKCQSSESTVIKSRQVNQHKESREGKTSTNLNSRMKDNAYRAKPSHSNIGRLEVGNHGNHVDSRSHSNSIRSISSSRHSSTNSPPARSRSRHRRSRSHSIESLAQSRRSNSNFRESDPVDALRTDVKYLIGLVKKCSQQQIEQERRMNRIEVSINKTFIMVGDLTNANNLQVQPKRLINTQIDTQSDAESDGFDRFDLPKFPILEVKEVLKLQKQLKNRRFKRFLIKHEQDYCVPSRIATDTVTLTKYLKRFIALDVRCKLTLKERTSGSEYTLMGDCHRVYLYLIDVMRAGYRISNKNLTIAETHTALRTVWGRSKQHKNAESNQKVKRLKRLNEKKNARRHRRHH